MHGSSNARRVLHFWIIFAITISFGCYGHERQKRKTYLVRYRNGENTVPVTVVLDFQKQAEHVINMNSRAQTKSVTFYDFKERAIAYKDMSNRECFIAKLTNETLLGEEQILKELKIPLETKPLRLTLDSSRRSLSPTEIRNLVGQKIAMFCRKMAAWLLLEPNYHIRSRRSLDAFKHSSEQSHRLAHHPSHQDSVSKLQINNKNRLLRRNKHNQGSTNVHTRKSRPDAFLEQSGSESSRFQPSRYHHQSKVPEHNDGHFPLVNSTSNFYFSPDTRGDYYRGNVHPRIIPLQPIPNQPRDSSLQSHQIHQPSRYYTSDSSAFNNRFERPLRHSSSGQFGTEYVMPLKISRSSDFSHPLYSYDLLNNNRSEANKPTISPLHSRGIQHPKNEKLSDNIEEEPTISLRKDPVWNLDADRKRRKISNIHENTGKKNDKEQTETHGDDRTKVIPPSHKEHSSPSSTTILQFDETIDTGEEDSEYFDGVNNDENEDDNDVESSIIVEHNSFAEAKHSLNRSGSIDLKSTSSKERSDTPIEENRPLKNTDSTQGSEKFPSDTNNFPNTSIQEGVPQRQERLQSVLKLFTPDEIVIDIGKIPKNPKLIGIRRSHTPANTTVSDRTRKQHRQREKSIEKSHDTAEFPRIVASRDRIPNVHQKSVNPSHLPAVLPPGVSVYPRHPNAPFAELAFQKPVGISSAKRAPVHGQRHHHHKKHQPSSCCTNSRANSVCCKNKGSCCSVRRHRGPLVTSCCNSEEAVNGGRELGLGNSREFSVPQTQNDEAVSLPKTLGKKELCNARKMCRTLYRSTQAVLICREGNVPGC